MIKSQQAQKKTTFVLVIPRFEDIFHAYYAGEIIKGVSLSASRLNADVLIHITDRSDHKAWLQDHLLNPHAVDGIIFADIDNDLGVVKQAIGCGVPSLVLNNIIDEPINYIAVDNRQAASQVVDYLISYGHKKIATVAGDMSTQAGIARLEGYREALHANQLENSKDYIKFGDFLRTPARQAAEKLLSLKTPPTAIFVASDVMALEVLDVAKAKGLRVPEDLSIVGFDDNPISASASIPLTTVAQPLVEMGRVGAETLGLIRQGRSPLPAKRLLPTQLVKRQSVAVCQT